MPYNHPHLVLPIRNLYSLLPFPIWCSVWFKPAHLVIPDSVKTYTKYQYKGLGLLSNNLVNHNLFVFCWALLQYHKELLHHNRLDTCITPSRWCHHYLTQLTSRFRPWWLFSQPPAEEILQHTSTNIKNTHTRWTRSLPAIQWQCKLCKKTWKSQQSNPVPTPPTSISNEHIQ